MCSYDGSATWFPAVAAGALGVILAVLAFLPVWGRHTQTMRMALLIVAGLAFAAAGLRVAFPAPDPCVAA